MAKQPLQQGVVGQRKDQKEVRWVVQEMLQGCQELMQLHLLQQKLGNTKRTVLQVAAEQHWEPPHARLLQHPAMPHFQ
jgi:hypothetical protein